MNPSLYALANRLRLVPEVQTAIDEQLPMVALETAVVSHGLPRPLGLEILNDMCQLVRKTGAVPAPISLLDGVVTVGDCDELAHGFAEDRQLEKLGTRELAWAMAHRRSGGTTVSATLAIAHYLGLRFFATGGIGGVHRDWSEQLDVSADLRAIAQAPVCVVAAGAKSILDVPATLEALEAFGVPVWVMESDLFPQFYSRGDAQIPAPRRVDDTQAIVEACWLHWSGMQRREGILLANPVPAAHAIDQQEMDSWIEAALIRARASGVRGQAVTPFLLAEVASASAGRTRDANLALLRHNAQLAGRLAVAWNQYDGSGDGIS